MSITTIEKYSLPISSDYEISQDMLDGRFKKVKVYVAHTGLNLKNTAFSKEALTMMMNTLSGIPIVGYLDKDEFGEEDFKGHEHRITINEKDGIKIEYVGIPFGFIPKDNNANFEFREGKEWLTVEGILWNKFPKAIDVFSKSHNRKSQSMEIQLAKGHMDNEGVFNIESAIFDAICILGDKNKPAMAGSTIEMFDLDSQDFTKSFKEMMSEFYEKGEDDVKDKNENLNPEELEKQEVTQEEEVEETKAQEEAKEQENKDAHIEPLKEDSAGEDKKIDETKVEEGKPLDADDVQKLRGETEAEPEGDNVVLGGETPNTPDMVTTPTPTPTTTPTPTPNQNPDTVDFAKENEELKANQALLEQELEALRKFKEDKERQEKQVVLEKYRGKLSDEELQDFTNKLGDYNIEDLEKDIVFKVYKNGGALQDEATEAEYSLGRAYSFSFDKLDGKSKDVKDNPLGDFEVLGKYFK